MCVRLENAVFPASGVLGGYRAGGLDGPSFYIHMQKL